MTMNPTSLILGPPESVESSVGGLPRSLPLGWHAASAASLFARVRLSLTAPDRSRGDAAAAEVTVEGLLPTDFDAFGAVYIAGVDPAIQAAALAKIPTRLPVILGLSERVTTTPLARFSSLLDPRRTTLVVASESTLRAWRPVRDLDATTVELLGAGARAVLVLQDDSDLSLTFESHRFVIRSGLLGQEVREEATRERICGAMAGYLASIHHQEIPYLRKASLVALAASLAPRKNPLGRPDRWRVEHVARRLEGLTAFAPSPALPETPHAYRAKNPDRLTAAASNGDDDETGGDRQIISLHRHRLLNQRAQARQDQATPLLSSHPGGSHDAAS